MSSQLLHDLAEKEEHLHGYLRSPMPCDLVDLHGFAVQ